MSNIGAPDLASPDGQDDFANELHALIRAGRFGDASARLAEEIDGLSPELWEVCAVCSADALTLEGWEALNDALADPAWGHITAVGINISGDGVGETGEPLVETLVYTNLAFPFSNTDRAGILAENESFGSPWQGMGVQAGIFDPKIAGLAELHGMIVEEQARVPRPEPGSDAAIALFLADWWRTVQFHRLIEATHERHGLSRAVAIIIGSRDCGPFVETVIAPEIIDKTPIIVELAADAFGLVEADHQPDDTLLATPMVAGHDYPRAMPVMTLVPANEDDRGGTEFSANALRRKLAAAPDEEPQVAKASLLGRLFARR